MASYTVTVNTNEPGTFGVSAMPVVVTGVTESGGNQVASSAASGAASWSFTPTFSGSLLLFSIYDGTSGSSGQYTAATNNTLTINGHVVNGITHDAYCGGNYTGTVTGGTAVTLGTSAPSGSDAELWASYELHGSWTIDSSTPAPSTETTGASITTGAFTPPAGAVIAVLITVNAGSGTTVSVSSVTSSPSLTWTQRSSVSVASEGLSAIFTATVPLAQPPIYPAQHFFLPPYRWRKPQPGYSSPSAPSIPSPTGPQQVPSPQRFTPPFRLIPPTPQHTAPSQPSIPSPTVNVQPPTPFRFTPPFSWRPIQPVQQNQSATVFLPTGQIIVNAPPPGASPANWAPQQQIAIIRRPPFMWRPQAIPGIPQPVIPVPATVALVPGLVTVTGLPPIPVPGQTVPQHQMPLFTVPPFSLHRPQPQQSRTIQVVALPAGNITVSGNPVFPAAAWSQPQPQPGLRVMPPFRFRRSQVPQNFQSKPLVAGGEGVAGNIKITYVDPATMVLSSSYSGLQTTDAFGNAIPVGFMGRTYVQQPNSNPVVVESWHQATLLVGTGSGNGVNGLWYRLTSDNETELIWDLTMTGHSGATIYILPSAYRPYSQQNIISGVYGTGPASYPSGSYVPHLEIFGHSDTTPGAIIPRNAGAGATSTFMYGYARIPLDQP